MSADELFKDVVAAIETCHDNIGSSWLWEWNLPALFDALIRFYAEFDDDPEGWFQRQLVASRAALVVSNEYRELQEAAERYAADPVLQQRKRDLLDAFERGEDEGLTADQLREFLAAGLRGNEQP